MPRYHYWFLSHYLSQSSPPTYALSSLHRLLRVVSSSTLSRPCYYKRYSHTCCQGTAVPPNNSSLRLQLYYFFLPALSHLVESLNQGDSFGFWVVWGDILAGVARWVLALICVHTMRRCIHTSGARILQFYNSRCSDLTCIPWHVCDLPTLPGGCP